MDIGRAFQAIFDDRAWVSKLLLAFLFEILVVTSPAVVGYFIQYIHNVAEGHDTPLPEWGAFGTYWVRGILVILVAFVYVIVGLLLLIVGVIPALILLQASIIEYAMTGRAASLFALGAVWRRITTHTQFWIALGITLGMGVATSIVTSPFSSARSAGASALGGLLGALIGVYTGMVSQHLYGQYARVAYGRTAPPAPSESGPESVPPAASSGPT